MPDDPLPLEKIKKDQHYVFRPAAAAAGLFRNEIYFFTLARLQDKSQV
jgi:hypothetical protein